MRMHISVVSLPGLLAPLLCLTLGCPQNTDVPVAEAELKAKDIASYAVELKISQDEAKSRLIDQEALHAEAKRRGYGAKDDHLTRQAAVQVLLAELEKEVAVPDPHIVKQLQVGNGGKEALSKEDLKRVDEEALKQTRFQSLAKRIELLEKRANITKHEEAISKAAAREYDFESAP